MKTIHKYTIEAPYTTLHLPFGATPLQVREQNDKVCMWVLLDKNETRLLSRRFYVYGTGRDIVEGNSYVGTAHLHGGALVLHVFEDRP